MTILLQTCTACGARQYPERDLCRVCLSDTLSPAEDGGRGRLVADATLHRSLDPGFASTLPRRIGAVALDAGVRVIAFLGDGVAPGDRVGLRADGGVFIAEKE